MAGTMAQKEDADRGGLQPDRWRTRSRREDDQRPTSSLIEEGERKRTDCDGEREREDDLASTMVRREDVDRSIVHSIMEGGRRSVPSSIGEGQTSRQCGTPRGSLSHFGSKFCPKITFIFFLQNNLQQRNDFIVKNKNFITKIIFLQQK